MIDHYIFFILKSVSRSIEIERRGIALTTEKFISRRMWLPVRIRSHEVYR